MFSEFSGMQNFLHWCFLSVLVMCYPPVEVTKKTLVTFLRRNVAASDSWLDSSDAVLGGVPWKQTLQWGLQHSKVIKEMLSVEGSKAMREAGLRREGCYR